MVLKGEVVSNRGRIYQIASFVQEDETAHKIAEMLSVKPEKVNIGTVLETIRKNLGIALSQRQSEAVYMAFRSNLSIITGSPGTGKTTVLRAIIEVFQSLYPDKKILLGAPTGRASRRMAESTGRNDAKTLHSLLGLLGEGGYVRNKTHEPLDADLIIVDESSMIDMWLAVLWTYQTWHKGYPCGRCGSAAECRRRRCVPGTDWLRQDSGNCSG